MTAWKTGVSRKGAAAFQRIMLSSKNGYTEEAEEYIAEAGSFRYECLHTESWCFIMELKININNTQDQTAVLEIMADI